MRLSAELLSTVAERAHSGTPSYYAEHDGPKAFYPDPGSPWINEHTCGVCHECRCGRSGRV